MLSGATSLHVGTPNWTGTIRPRDQADLTGFLNSLARKSPKTVASYKEGLTAFATFTADQGMPLLEAARREHVETWLAHLHVKGNGPSTIRLRYATLNSFFRWAVDLDLRADSPMVKIRPEPIPSKLQPDYGLEEIEAVLAAIPAKSKSLLDLRDRAAVVFLMDTGLRAAELCSLKVGDLDTASRRATVIGKGQKQRRIAYGRLAADVLFRYLRQRAAEGPLFATRDGRAMTTAALRAALESRFKAAKVPFYGAHGFRRGWAIACLDAGADVLGLKELAGWASLEMAYRYVRASAQERALREYISPADRLGR